MKQNENKPEKTIRAGAIKATVWQNISEKDGKQTSYPTISIERNYKDKEGNWQTTHSFRPADLPKLALATQKAFEYITFRAEA